MASKHVFVDWNEVEAGYKNHIQGFEPKNALPEGIRLKVHRPVVDTEAAIVSDKPWEIGRVGSYASFAYVDGKYKCWYEAYGVPMLTEAYLCYAESDDGINWHKPNLGLVEYKGSKENNIILCERGQDEKFVFDHGYSVIYDEDAPNDEKYKMVFSHMMMVYDNWQIYVWGAVSPDGLHWNMRTFPFFVGGDTQLSLIKFDGKYIVYAKDQNFPIRSYYNTQLVQRRRTIQAESIDFMDFSVTTLSKCNNPLDTPDTDYYTSGVMKLPGCDDALISLYSKYHRSTDFLDISIAESRDAKLFYDLLPSEPYIGKNDIACEYNKCIYISNGILNLKDNMWALHFSSSNVSHNKYDDKKNYHSRIFRSVIREDGFVSVHAEEKGKFDTVPVSLTGNALELNASIEEGGYIKATLIDCKTQEVVEGFEAENCDAINNAKIWNTISWNGISDLSTLDKSIKYRIHFELYKADIYSFKL